MESGYGALVALPLFATLGVACLAAVALKGNDAMSRIAHRAAGIQLALVALSLVLALYDLGFHHSVWVASGNVHDLIVVVWVASIISGGTVIAASVLGRPLDHHFPALPLFALVLPYVGLWMQGHWQL